MPEQTGRVVVVTGASSGVGLATARALAGHGAHVVLAVRDTAKGQRTAAEIAGQHPGARMHVRRLDLADLGSIRAFAEGVRRDRMAIDVLVNNAGVMVPAAGPGPPGQDPQFATNHLGHFALTGLLLGALRARADPRVVTVSSAAHHRGRIRLDNLATARPGSPFAAYARSKLANVLFGLELDRRLRAAGSPVRSLLAHPGYAATNLQIGRPGSVMAVLGRIGHRLVAQSAAMGALPVLYAATHPEADGGQFFGPDRWFGGRGHPQLVRPAPVAADRATARRLWEVSEHLTGVRFDLPVPA